MTFGSVLPNGKVAFSTSPTWMTYAGDDRQCMDDTPVVIAQSDFCQTFTAEARVFRYNSLTSSLVDRTFGFEGQTPEPFAGMTNAWLCKTDFVAEQICSSWPFYSRLTLPYATKSGLWLYNSRLRLLSI